MAYYEDLAVLQNNFLKCLLCDEVIENHDSCIESHLKSRKHKELYMKRLMSQNSLYIQQTKLFCDICSCFVKIGGLTDHVENLQHCKILLDIKEAIEQDGKYMDISDSSNNINCCICNSQIDFTLQSVLNHIASPKHKRAKAMVLQPINGIFSVEDLDEYLWCKICQRYFDNYVELIFEHVQEKEHAETMRKIIRLAGGQIDIDNYLQSPKQDKAYCKKCNIEVPCNVDNLQSHVRGKKHDSSK